MHSGHPLDATHTHCRIIQSGERRERERERDELLLHAEQKAREPGFYRLNKVPNTRIKECERERRQEKDRSMGGTPSCTSVIIRPELF